MLHRIPMLRFRRILVGLALSSLSFTLLFLGQAFTLSAQAAPSGIVLVPGTVSLGDNVKTAIVAALGSAASLFPNVTYFAVTDWRQEGAWATASVIGLSRVGSGGTWSIDDGSWVGIVLLHQSRSGAWQGATQGTRAFSSLIAASPNSFLVPAAKRSLDPLQSSAMSAQTGSYIFPLQPGTLMYYGNLGVHDNGFTSVVSGWKAVDLMSDGDTTQNHAPNRLIAAEAGTISYVCKDSTSVAVNVADFFYTHLLNNANLVVGHVFNQGDYMGQLRTGSFSNTCGYASQNSGTFHVHWGFPNADLQVEDWTLSMTTGNWTNATSTVTPGHWMLAGPTPPAPTNLVETSATQNIINFAWGGSTGADGYHIYSWNGTAYALLSTVPATQTTYAEMRSACGWSQNYQVSAYNSIGDSPRAGPLHAITVPCDPSPLSPANGSSNAWNYDVVFQSAPAAGASGYIMEYWGGSYATPQTCGWSTTASCDAGLLPPGNTYSWHVKARSAAGETDWSPTWTFTIQPLPCYSLALTHTGSGSDPSATPLNSTGCSAGQYHPTDTIAFSAAANTGWTVGSWSGTDNNSSTSSSNTLTMPNGNSTVAVNYTPIVPGVPALISPSNGATKQPINITLSWNPASGAVSYDYCLGTSAPCTAWISTGTNTSVALSNLALGTLYYWAARATNIYGNSSVSALWQFTTGNKPGSFAKSSPASGATAQPATTLLQWASSKDAAEYQYCLDTVNDGTCQGYNWISTGTQLSADLTGILSPQTTYYWQVRALNSFGVQYADNGWWSFTTAGVPGTFTKQAPSNSAANVPVRPTLTWSSSPYATAYEYCIDQTNDGVCGGSWLRVVGGTSITLPSTLQPLTTYYWHVHALNGFGTTASNGDAWWSFTTGATPAAFSKIAPVDGAQNLPIRLLLSWQAATGATGYRYCVSTTRGTCSSWTGVGTSTSVIVSGLAGHTTYYWGVRAVNGIGMTPANGGTWWAFTTGYLPAAFTKISPPNTAVKVSVNSTLTWNASAYATTYDYCLATTTTCAAWINVGNVTSVAVKGLKASTQYYWQVRARNSIGVTLATGGLWPFRTGDAPGAFSKSSPLNGSLNQPPGVTLTWAASTGATSYQYCIDTVNDNICQGYKWINTGPARSVSLTSLGLAPNTVYYWEVCAFNSFGARCANGGAWWAFTTAP